jgi:hypothetical protein
MRTLKEIIQVNIPELNNIKRKRFIQHSVKKEKEHMPIYVSVKN